MTAKQLTDSILQMAIQGKLVPQDPNDEPASVLLERIREEKRRLVAEGKLKKKELEENNVNEDDLAFVIPKGWVAASLKTLSLDSADGPFGSNLKKDHYTDNKEVRIIQLSNIGESGWKDSNVKYTTYEHLETIKRSEAYPGDIIIAKMMPAGRAIICPDCDNKFVLSSDAVRFNFSNVLYKKYLYYAINSSIFKNQVYGNVQGITRVRTSLTKLRDYYLPIPPIKEQYRIVDRIEEILPFVAEYGEAYEEASRMDAQLPDKLKKSILQEAIMGKLGTQDPNDEPAKCLLEDIRAEKQKLVEEGVLKKKDLVETPVEDDEIPFNIPESWTWIRFGDLVFTSTGKTPARGEVVYWSSNDYPWVSISDMKQGEVVNSTKEFISKKAANDCFHNEISKKGTLIMSFKLTVGRTSILGMDAFHNEAIISIRTYADNDNYTRDYLAYILPIIANSGDSKDAIKGKTLNSKSIYNLLVPLPPLAEQHRIVQKIEKLYAEIDNMTVENNININEIEVTDNE